MWERGRGAGVRESVCVGDSRVWEVPRECGREAHDGKISWRSIFRRNYLSPPFTFIGMVGSELSLFIDNARNWKLACVAVGRDEVST